MMITFIYEGKFHPYGQLLLCNHMNTFHINPKTKAYRQFYFREKKKKSSLPTILFHNFSLGKEKKKTSLPTILFHYFILGEKKQAWSIIILYTYYFILLSK